MHFTTRCPACGTLFRVVNDQLKLSDGWVRCGDCNHVFDATLQLQVEQVLVAPQADSLAEVSLSDTSSLAVAALDTPADETSDVPVDARPPAQAPSSEALPEPGFIRQAQRRAYWRSPGVRAALLLVSLLLTMVLALQWAVHHRDRLAVAEPALTPWLAMACEAVGCELSPVRRLDAVVIDSTALVRRLDHFYAFDLVLKNTASIPLAVPALELTLTRLDDSVLARRVFTPEELPGLPVLLPARDSVAVSLRLSLALGEDPSMAGYRALVFYP
jgi:predicted Zn finger-like uncharacterized protein